MTNGSNNWNVGFSRISWLENVLRSHKNVASFQRHHDIVFDVRRKKGGDISLLCLDEYVLGLTATTQALAEFPGIDIIFVGGTWNKYTPEAKEYCIDSRVGLYNATELNGALWKDEHWGYSYVDDKGNPVYQVRAEQK